MELSQTSEDSQTSVRVEKVSKVFSQASFQVHALREVSLEIESASFTSISGPSGSGKTTLLNMIGGLDRPSSGEVYIAGERIDQKSSSELADLRLRKIGFVFQAFNLIPVLTALENVAFVMQLRGMPEAERSEKARAILAEVGLEGRENRRPGELSGGQQQRVAVARAIVGEPSLVLADEPTANLDSATAGALLELMQRMNLERGITFVFSTHDQLVMSFARRLVRLKDGGIESDEVRA